MATKQGGTVLVTFSRAVPTYLLPTCHGFHASFFARVPLAFKMNDSAFDRPRAKGQRGGGLIPLRQNGDFSASWNERAMAIGGVCRWLLVVFGPTRQKNPFFFWRVWAGFLPLAPYT